MLKLALILLMLPVVALAQNDPDDDNNNNNTPSSKSPVVVTTQKLIVTQASENRFCGTVAGDAKMTPVCYPDDPSTSQPGGIYDRTIATDIATCAHDKNDGSWHCWGIDDGYDKPDLTVLNGAQPSDVIKIESNICVYGKDSVITCAKAPGWTTGGFDIKDPNEDQAKKFGPFPGVKSVAADTDGLCVVDANGVECQTSTYSVALAKGIVFAHPRLVAISRTAICAVDDGGLRCFKKNNATPVATAPDWTSVKEIRATDGGICAILATGALQCQAFDPNEPIDLPTDLTNVVSFDTNKTSWCALHSDATVECWGSLSRLYKAPPELTHALDVSVGSRHECATDASGVTYCWGHNTHGELNQPLRSGTPIQHAISSQMECVYNSAGVICRGDSYGNDITDKLPQFNNPQQLVLPNRGYGADACAIDKLADGTTKAVCFGENQKVSTVPTLTNPSMIATNGTDACALNGDGKIVCWGANNFGSPSNPPRRLKKLVMNENFACAIDAFGLMCWGPEATKSMKVPSNLLMDGAVKDVALGSSRACALTYKHAVQCWGGSSKDADPDLKNPIALIGFSSTFCATDDNGVECFGSTYELPGKHR